VDLRALQEMRAEVEIFSWAGKVAELVVEGSLEFGIVDSAAVDQALPTPHRHPLLAYLITALGSCLDLDRIRIVEVGVVGEVFVKVIEEAADIVGIPCERCHMEDWRQSKIIIIFF
jgi:hypothetical protein